MKIIICFTVLLLLSIENNWAQLVTKRDYTVAFALQAGAETSLLLPGSSPDFKVRPVAGLKMTFPFTRKWFMGAEINYSRLLTGNKYKLSGFQLQSEAYMNEFKTKLDIKRIQVPLYIKYMLASNRASVLFGVYMSFMYDRNFAVYPEVSSPSGEMVNPGEFIKLSGSLNDEVDMWEGGLTVGYEQNLLKGLDVTFKINAGIKDILKSDKSFSKKLYPLQANLTLSYRILRLGGCKCD